MALVKRSLAVEAPRWNLKQLLQFLPFIPGIYAQLWAGYRKTGQNEEQTAGWPQFSRLAGKAVSSASGVASVLGSALNLTTFVFPSSKVHLPPAEGIWEHLSIWMDSRPPPTIPPLSPQRVRKGSLAEEQILLDQVNEIEK